MKQNFNLSMLEIHNFRQYRDVKIKFSQDAVRPFTIVRGANGAGKTNIMNAITWCLYGSEMHPSLGDRDMPIVNTQALKETADGSTDMHVTLELANNEGPQIRITRKLTLYNHGNVKDIKADPKHGFSIPSESDPDTSQTYQFYTPQVGWESTRYFDKSISRLLPRDLVGYFLFDGEKLEDFFDNIEDVKKGIEDVSQIKIAENSIKTLESLMRRLRSKAKNLAPDAEQHREMLDTIDKKLQDTNNAIESLNDNLRIARSRVTEIEGKIGSYGGDVGKIQQQVKNLKAEIQSQREERDALRKEFSDYVVEHTPRILMLESMGSALERIQTHADKGILPPKIKDTFIQELLEVGRCICGSDISEGTESRTNINNMRKSARYSTISNLCLELKYELNGLMKTGSVLSTLNSYQEKMLRISDSIKRKENERNDLEAQIGSTDVDEIKKLSSEKSKLIGSIDQYNQDLGTKNNEKLILDEGKDRFTRSLAKELSKDATHRYLLKQLEFCQAAESGLSRIKNDLLSEVREKVQKHTKDYFLQFIWKKNTYDDVDISDSYEINAHHVDGYLVRSGLSKGEKLVLALSFMAALRKITGFGFPLVIDTPLGRVSGEPRHNIAKFLPRFLTDTQVTLLVTDSEYQSQIKDDDNNDVFPPIRDTIKQHVGRDYNIVFEGGRSAVEENEY